MQGGSGHARRADIFRGIYFQNAARRAAFIQNANIERCHRLLPPSRHYTARCFVLSAATARCRRRLFRPSRLFAVRAKSKKLFVFSARDIIMPSSLSSFSSAAERFFGLSSRHDVRSIERLSGVFIDDIIAARARHIRIYQEHDDEHHYTRATAFCFSILSFTASFPPTSFPHPGDIHIYLLYYHRPSLTILLSSVFLLPLSPSSLPLLFLQSHKSTKNRICQYMSREFGWSMIPEGQLALHFPLFWSQWDYSLKT